MGIERAGLVFRPMVTAQAVTRDDADLVGGRRARAVVAGAADLDPTESNPWIRVDDADGHQHNAPLFGADHWARFCPCGPALHNGIIIHRLTH